MKVCMHFDWCHCLPSAGTSSRPVALIWKLVQPWVWPHMKIMNKLSVQTNQNKRWLCGSFFKTTNNYTNQVQQHQRCPHHHYNHYHATIWICTSISCLLTASLTVLSRQQLQINTFPSSCSSSVVRMRHSAVRNHFRDSWSEVTGLMV